MTAINQSGRINVICFVLFFSTCYSSTLYSQKEDFSGTWELEKRTSLSGKDYENGIPTEIRIIQTKDSMKVGQKTRAQNGEDLEINEVLSFDGKESTSATVMKNKKVSVLAWTENGKQCIETSNIIAPGGGAIIRKITYTMSFVYPGKTMIIIRTDENFITGDSWSMKGEYKKS